MSEATTSQTHLLRRTVQEVMDIEDVTAGVPSPYTALLGNQNAQATEVVRLRGHLRLSPDQAYTYVSQHLEPLGYTPLLRREQDKQAENKVWDVILALPGQLRQADQHVKRAAILFGLTVLSCLFAGAQMVEGLTQVSFNLLDGWPFALSLLAILLAHEFGHYIVARRLGTPVSLPYFIPMPIGLGTMGAVINMTAPPRNRRHLLAIAAAGPLAGLALAIPILWIGLQLSQVTTLPPGQYMLEGNSILYATMKFLAFGQLLPSATEDVFIHPVAFAGWAGLLVTGLNLIPAGQLDGGHIVYALVGEKAARWILWGVIVALAVLSIFWIGWLLWVGLILIFGQLRVAPLDEITELTSPQRVLAVLMVLIFLLVFTPVPMKVVGSAPAQPDPSPTELQAMASGREDGRTHKTPRCNDEGDRVALRLCASAPLRQRSTLATLCSESARQWLDRRWQES